MKLISIINDKLEHRRLVNRYGGKRRKSGITATRKYTEGYVFEAEVKRPGLIKRLSNIAVR